MLATVHEALAAYPHRVDGGRPARHEQLVHDDFRSANILHDGATISAVLDLEEVRYDARVADLITKATPVYTALDSAPKAGLTPTDIVTNQFLDKSISIK